VVAGLYGLCIELLGVLPLIVSPSVLDTLGGIRVPVLHTCYDGIRSSLTLVHVLPCVLCPVAWLSWTMWAFSCSWMHKVLWVWGLIASVGLNRAFSLDTNNCHARPRPSASFSVQQGLVRCQHQEGVLPG
jgi:hypothetical protein